MPFQDLVRCGVTDHAVHCCLMQRELHRAVLYYFAKSVYAQVAPEAVSSLPSDCERGFALA